MNRQKAIDEADRAVRRLGESGWHVKMRQLTSGAWYYTLAFDNGLLTLHPLLTQGRSGAFVVGYQARYTFSEQDSGSTDLRFPAIEAEDPLECARKMMSAVRTQLDRESDAFYRTEEKFCECLKQLRVQ